MKLLGLLFPLFAFAGQISTSSIHLVGYVPPICNIYAPTINTVTIRNTDISNGFVVFKGPKIETNADFNFTISFTSDTSYKTSLIITQLSNFGSVKIQNEMLDIYFQGLILGTSQFDLKMMLPKGSIPNTISINTVTTCVAE